MDKSANEEMIVAVNAIYAIAQRSLKNIQDFNGVWTRDLAIPVRCSTNWAMKPLTFGAGQLWVHKFPWKKWVLMIYEMNHIWTAEIKWKWRNCRRSERNLCNCIKKPEKNSGLQRGLNPWPCDTGTMLYQLSYEATDLVNWVKFYFPLFQTHYRTLPCLKTKENKI